MQPPMFKYSPDCMDTTMQNLRQTIKYTTRNYSRQLDYSKQVQKISIKYIINITMLQRLTSHHSTVRRLYIYQVMIKLWKHMTGNKCLEIIIQHWKIQALIIRMIENYMYFAISLACEYSRLSSLTAAWAVQRERRLRFGAKNSILMT